jgi:putative ABC transport system permease protein
MNLPLTLASRYLLGRKLRTVLTTLAVVFGVLVIFGMNIILPTMLASLQINAMAAQGAVDLTIVHQSGDAFPQDVLAKVLAVDGVRAATVSLHRTVNLPPDFFDADPVRPDHVLALALIGIDPFGAKTVRAYPLMAGRYLEQGDAASALISQSLADSLSIKLGDQLRLPTVNGLTKLTVVGLLLPRLGPGNEEVLVTLPEAQALTAEPGRVNTIDVNFDSVEEARRAEIAQNVQSVLGADYKVASLLGGDEMFASLKAGQIAFSLFGALALFMGAFIIFNTFRTVVAERRHDIGMLRALGASRRLIVGMILAEGLLQGVIGTLVGLLLGYLAGLGVLALIGPMMFQFLNLKMGSPVVSPMILAVSVLLGVGVTVFAGLVPAVRASRVTPLEALRPSSVDLEFMRGTGRWFALGLALIVLAVLALFSGQLAFIAPGGVLFLVGVVLVVPGLVRPITSIFGKLVAFVYARAGTGELAQGNLTRQPSRVAVTASATMLGLAVIVAAGGLVVSAGGTLSDVMRKSLGSDYLFVPPSVALWGSNIGADARLAERLRGVDGVGDVSTMRYAGSAVGEQPISLLGIDPLVFPKVAGLHFQQGIEFLAYQELAQSRALIANGAFLAATGAKVGDTVELATPRGKVAYHIAAMASDLLNLKITSAFISQANMQADFGVTEDVFLQFNLKPGADKAAADAQIRSITADYPQFRVIAGKTYYGQLQSEIDAAFSGMYFALALLALPSLIAMLNTLAIGVIERTREIGMLRAVGATKKQIYTMVVAEALLLALIGAVFGIACGLYLGYIFVSGLGTIFPLGYAFPLSGIVAALVIGLIFGGLAAIIPARQAARMNVVEALRYE